MPHNVLIVDDHPDNREIYRTVFEHGGCVVHEARNGQEAVDLAFRILPDIILLDMTMPVMDGWTAARLLKGDPATAQIPIIALTAHATEGASQSALEAGCDEYLAKPIAPREVFDFTKRLLDETA